MGFETIEEALGSLSEKNVASTHVLQVRTIDQFGPNCGIYALWLVMDYWFHQGAAPKPPPPRSRHVVPDRGRTVTFPDDDNEYRLLGELRDPTTRPKVPSVRRHAKSIKVTTQGTVLSTDALGRVALTMGNYLYEDFDCATTDEFIRKCSDAITAGFPVIVGVDVKHKGTNTGTPFVRRIPASRAFPNEGGHWAVMHAVRNYRDGESTFIASHWGQYHVWDGLDIAQSNLGLQWYPKEVFVKRAKKTTSNRLTISLGSSVYVEGEEYIYHDWEVDNSGLPAGPVRTVPLTDIRGMRGKVLIVRPYSERTARGRTVIVRVSSAWPDDSLSFDVQVRDAATKKAQAGKTNVSGLCAFHGYGGLGGIEVSCERFFGQDWVQPGESTSYSDQSGRYTISFSTQ